MPKADRKFPWRYPAFLKIPLLIVLSMMFLLHQDTDRPALCPVLSLMSLAFADEAFEYVKSPEDLQRISVDENRLCYELKWKEGMQKIPIIRKTTATRKARHTELSSSLGWTAAIYGHLLKGLGKRAGFEQELRIYDLRRGAGNAFDCTMSDAQRNQILGHTNNNTFAYYINRRVKKDTQSIFLGEVTNEDDWKRLMKIQVMFQKLR